MKPNQFYALIDLVASLPRDEIIKLVCELDTLLSDNQFTNTLIKELLKGGYNGTYQFVEVD